MTPDTKVVFVMSMGLAGCNREEVFTLEELGIDLDESHSLLDEQLEEAWQEWRNEYLDGAWYFEDKG